MTEQAKGRRLVALVPMRHHSERVPGKNYRPLAGKPLYAYILDGLLACSKIEKVAIDTDSPVIVDGMRKDYPDVLVIERPESLRGDNVSMNDVLLYDITQLPAAFYLQTHSTNPLLKPLTISCAVDAFLEAYPRHDSLFSVTPLRKRLWDSQGNPINHDPSVLLRTQDLPPIFEENSCLYIFERTLFQQSGNRLGRRPLMFPMDAAEAWDIDDELDFEIVEWLARRRR
jgi:CMP-N-acetylneuraminic acid synthetase